VSSFVSGPRNASGKGGNDLVTKTGMRRLSRLRSTTNTWELAKGVLRTVADATALSPRGLKALCEADRANE
jgi:hypothetical protein